MPEKEEKTTELSLTEIAEELRAMADDLTEGRVRIGRQRVKVGEPVALKMKQKLKGDMAYFAMSVQAPLVERAGPPAGHRQKMAPRSQTEAGYGGKKLKREIGRLWKSIAKQIERKQMPDGAETEGMLTRCEEFNLFATGEWQAAWADCTLAVEKCFIDAATGDWPAAKAGVDLVNRMMHDCHSAYK